MSEPMFKYVNVCDQKTGRPLRDRKTGRLASRRVQLTSDEVEAFEAERTVLTARNAAAAADESE